MPIMACPANRPIEALVALVLLASCATAASQARSIGDADILAYSARPFDKAAMMGKRDLVGMHNGVAVVADYPCSDVCPAYTTQIVHYDAEPGPACDKAGGVVEMRVVPIAIAVQMKPFCVPQVLARKTAEPH
jgi:hypothetical protein